jgi:hypothetical protein
MKPLLLWRSLSLNVALEQTNNYNLPWNILKFALTLIYKGARRPSTNPTITFFVDTGRV